MADFSRARKLGIVGGSLGLASYFIYLLYNFLEADTLSIIGLIFGILAVKEIARELNKNRILERYLVSAGAGAVGTVIGIFYAYSALTTEASDAMLVVSFVLLSISAIFGVISFNMITNDTSISQFRISASLTVVYVPIAAAYLFTRVVAGFDIIISLAGYLFLIGGYYSLDWVASIPPGSRLPGDSSSLPKAEHGFYRDYIFADEGVYRIELLSDEKRILAKDWGLFIFAAGLAQEYSVTVFLLALFVLLASGYLNKYLWKVIGRRIRTKIALNSTSNDTKRITRMIPWSGFKQFDLYDNAVVMKFLDGKSEKSTIQKSDYDRLIEILPSKLGNRFLMKPSKQPFRTSQSSNIES